MTMIKDTDHRPDRFTCPSCQGPKYNNFWLCKRCEQKYGWNRCDWPNWLVGIVRLIELEEIANLREASHTVPFNHYEYQEPDRDSFADLDDNWMRGLWAEYGKSKRPSDAPYWWDDGGEMAFPWDVYATKAENRAYRKANGIYARL